MDAQESNMRSIRRASQEERDEQSELSAAACSLLEWADENLLKAECITHAIADTGDYDSMWHVEDCDGRKSYGPTLTEAIRDAMKGDDDPTRYDYVPPEFR